MGPLEVRLGGVPIKLTSRRVAALFSWVGAMTPAPVKKDALGAAFWPHADLVTRRRNLRQLIFLARRSLESHGDSAILTTDDEIYFSEHVETDLSEFNRRRNSGSIDERLIAHKLYRGHLVDDLEESEWLQVRQEVHQCWTDLSLGLIKELRQKGDLQQACQIARNLALMDPFDERARFTLIKFLAATNGRSAALQEYADFEKRLAKDLGTTPSVTLQDLLAKSKSGSSETEIYVPSPRRHSWAIGSLAVAITCLCMWGAIRLANIESRAEDRIALIQRDDPTAITAQVAAAQSLAESAWQAAYGPDEEAWRTRLAPLEDRLLAIMKWATEYDPVAAVRIGGALERTFFLINRQREWAVLLESALSRAPKESSLTYARAEIALVIAYPTRDVPGNLRRLSHAREICETSSDQFLKIQVVRAEGFLNAAQENHAAARDLYERALGMARDAHDERQTALCLFCLGIMGPDPRVPAEDDFQRRMRYGFEGYDHFDSIGNVWGIRASASQFIGNLKLLVPYPKLAAEALARLLSAADRERNLGNPAGRFDDTMAAAKLAVMIEDRVKACDLLYKVSATDVGANLPFSDREKLRLACYRVDPKLAATLFAESGPIPELPAESALEIIESATN